VLRPLKRITRTAQAVSQENLHQRIALDGPEDELKELADTFDHMLGRLDAAFGRQRAFVANASHELRTPLTIIRTEADVALEKRRPDVASLLAGMGSIRTATERSERLIDGLLTLARVDRQESHRESIGLNPLAAQAIDEVRPLATQRSLLLTTDLKPVSVTGDTRLLETLLRNLLENAVRHNQPGGWIAIRTWARDERAVLEVENSGEVIADELASRLTEPFQRQHRHHQNDGVGLGLSIVSAIVAAHDGELTITAPPTGGLRVRVEFRATRPAPAPKQRAAGRPAGEVREPTVPRPRPRPA
jgi:signal transduction histidine kinase